ncbi:MAG TPA: ABC transporter permease [Actinomycetota bacterium]
MGRVPVGRRNLFAERRRAALGIAGVAASFLMVLALDGIVNGATRELTRYIDTSPADVFVAQRGVTNMHMASSWLPLANVKEIRALPSVSWADPILYAPDALTTPTGQQLTYVIGYQPGGRGGPITLSAGSDPGPGEIVIDAQAAQDLRLAVEGSVSVLGRTWRISGLTSGLTNIANTVAFVRFEDFAGSRRVPDIASYILVGGSVSPDSLARRIEANTELTALPRAGFSEQEGALARDMSAQVLQIMTLAAFLIGLAIIGLVLYTATLSRLQEIGVMKALGAMPRRLAVVVLSQALWTVGMALALALVLAFSLSWVLARSAGNITIAFGASAVVPVALGGVVVGVLGAVAPVIRVRRVDPVSVFRR